MNFRSKIINCSPCNLHTRDAYGNNNRVHLALKWLRWVQWGRVWRARVKRGSVRRQPPNDLCVAAGNCLPIGRSEPCFASTSKIPLGRCVLMSSNGSILFITHKYTSNCISFFLAILYLLWIERFIYLHQLIYLQSYIGKKFIYKGKKFIYSIEKT